MKRFRVLLLVLLMTVSVAYAAPTSVFEMEDFGHHGTAPGWLNVGWRYDNAFDTNSITEIEVGLKDAAVS